MKDNQSFTSTIETIRTVNHSSGISNNIMVYKLALIIEQYSPLEKSTTTLLTPEREALQAQLGTTLSQNAQTVENYRQTLKNKYYEEYLKKFGVTQQSNVLQQDNSTRVENLIAQKKQTFLQKMSENGHKSPLGQKSNYSSPDKNKEAIQSETPSSQQNQTAKQFLIPAIMRTVMTMGKDTGTGRIYEGIAYRLQLLMKEGMQFVSVSRKSGLPQTAFSAYKDESNEFKITENNLSPSETQRFITFDKQQRQQPQAQDNPIHKDNSTELGD
ncbi:hypothetical protein A6770_36995 [Nostoc minutum NIES-26]|uniref:Uncharacterized protein n=1 Tax=Nostoc minutum NIES-26 TaxID=1844469 RepID=A0A367S0D5_9NOSO|nr:hypothetical protein A6770_36995 [Nostoc minutum NIES-26]